MMPFIFWRFIKKDPALRKLFISLILFVVSMAIASLISSSEPAEHSLLAWIYLIVLFCSVISLFSVMLFLPQNFKPNIPSSLDQEVAERTAELNALNQLLRMEIEVRKQAEKEVAKREKRFKALIENIADGIILSDETARVVYQSPSVARILGYPLDDRRPKPLAEYIHDEDRAAFQKLNESLMALPGQPLHFQFRFKHHNGSYIWLEGVVLNLLHDRSVNGFVANCRDISERRRGEENLRYERHLLRTLIDNIPDYIYVKDNELRHLVNNKANVALIGAASESETIGKTVLDYFDVALATSFMEADRKVLNSREPVIDLEEKIIGYANEVRWLLTSKIPLIENNQVMGLVGVSRDITERKNAEMLLKELNASLALQASKLAASNAALQQFAYVVSHDLQEPLRMVKSFLELLKKKHEHKLDEEAVRFIQFAVDGADRMKALINDLLRYARVETIQQEMFERVDMNELARETEHTLQEVLHSCNASLHIHPLPVVSGVRSQLGQVLQNLVGNAIHYRGEATPIVTIEGTEDSLCWKFSVCDNGIGIDPRFFENIFGIFQRLHQDNERKGNGLGLAICKKIVENHGGRIWVESTPGVGSTFHFTIRKLHN